MRYTPTDKLYDAFIALLAGAHGLVEINGGVRPDAALQAAFGRTACAIPLLFSSISAGGIGSLVTRFGGSQ